MSILATFPGSPLSRRNPSGPSLQPFVQTALILSALLPACATAHRTPPDELEAGMAQVNGALLYFEVQGRGDPVVLLEGANLDLRLWDPQFRRFASEFRVLRYDFRGFGRSSRNDASSYRSHEDLSLLMDHLEIERAHVFGLSLGGRIAVDFALEHPERVRSLVLVGPGLSGWEWEPFGEDWRERFIEAIQAGDSLRAADLWLESHYMAPAMEIPALALELRRLARANSRVFAHQSLEVPLAPPAVERLGEIRVPTLLILGSLDVPDIHRIVARLASEIPDAEQVVFDGVGHLPNREAPERFEQVVKEFLRRH